MSWIIAAVLSWWFGIAGATVRRELLLLESRDASPEDYSVLSLLQRLGDDPVALGLRLRFSRLISTALVPAGLAMGMQWAGAAWFTLMLVLGWLAVALADSAGGSSIARRVARFPAGAGLAVWARLTGPLARIARPLVSLRGRREAPEARGFVLAETQAALAPSGGRLGREERRLLRRLLASTAILVSDIMVRWPQVATIDAATTGVEAERELKASGRSRLPVLRNGRVMGLLTVKDVLSRRQAGDGAFTAAEVMRPAYFVRNDATVQGLLDELREARVHLAVVVDMLGRPVGLVTMEDILEEIVGELYDEREAPGDEA